MPLSDIQCINFSTGIGWKSQIFSTPLSFSALDRSALSKLWKRFTDPDTIVFQVADGEDLVIIACNVFDWSTRLTNGQTPDGWTDGRTELQWLRRATAVAAAARKMCTNYPDLKPGNEFWNWVRVPVPGTKFRWQHISFRFSSADRRHN